MAPFGCHPRCFQPGGTRTYHDDLPAWAGCLLDGMGNGCLTPSCSVMNAKRLAAFIDAVEAIGCTHTWPDFVLAPLHHFADDVRIGDMSPGHADHVQLTIRNGMSGRGDIGNTSRMEGREFRRCLHLAGKVEMWGGTHAGHRDDLGQCRIRFNRPPDNVEEIDLSGLGQLLRDFHAFLFRKAGGEIFVCNEPNADDELVANSGTDRIQNHVRKAQPVAQRAAEFIVAVVGGG